MSAKKTAKKAHRIEDDTPIIPHIVAEGVIHEVDRCAPLEMSPTEMRALADKIADRADAIYASNERFRKKIRGRGNTGRDHLYAFMRHWLASELKKSRPAAFARLPQSFMSGEELDCGQLRPSLGRKTPAQLDADIAEALADAPRTGHATKRAATLKYEGKPVSIDPSPRTIRAFELDRPYVVRHRGQLYTIVFDTQRGHRVAHPAQVVSR